MTAALALGWGLLAGAALWAGNPRSIDRAHIGATHDSRRRSSPLTVRAGALGELVKARVPWLDAAPPVVVGVVAVGVVILSGIDLSLGLMTAASFVMITKFRRVAIARNERAAMVRQIPASVDLLRLCLDSGLTPRLSIARIAVVSPSPLGPRLAAVVRRVERGESLASAIGPLTVPGEPLASLARAVVT